VRVEAWVIGLVAAFFGVVSPVYWLLTGDETGTSALVMTTLLAALMAFFLGVVAKQLPDRPEDRLEADVVDGAGEVGFFPPYSWWPLYGALALGTCVMGVIFGWWLFIIGVAVGAVVVVGFVFEYYRGYHAH